MTESGLQVIERQTRAGADLETLIRTGREYGMTDSEIIAAFSEGVARGAIETCPPAPEWWTADGGDGYASAIEGLIREAQGAGLETADIMAAVSQAIPSAALTGWTAETVTLFVGGCLVGATLSVVAVFYKLLRGRG